MVYCCNGENEEHIFDIGFIEGYEKAKADYKSLECVNCDEVKQTHQICMDCIGKLIKENQETLYTEEDLRKAYFKGAADVHDKCTERTWRGVEVNVDIQKLKECNEQFMQSLKTKTK